MTAKLLPTNPTRYPLDWTAVFFFTTIHALALLAPWFFSWSAVGLTIFLHWLFGSIGICLGYHRLLSHRSFQLPKWLEYPIAVIGALALQGGPIFWVAGHRLHHAYTEDKVGTITTTPTLTLPKQVGGGGSTIRPGGQFGC